MSKLWNNYILLQNLTNKRRKLTKLRQGLDQDYKHTSLVKFERMFRDNNYFNTFAKGIHEVSVEVSGQVENQLL